MQLFNPLEKFGINSVTAAFSRRSDGNMSFSFGEIRQSLDNRKKFLFGLGIDYRDLITAKQVHGKNVELITQENKGSGALDYESSIPDTDGLITNQRGVPIAILTADCLSVFIYDPAHLAIAILHAGWRSTEQNIAQQGVLAMQNKFGCHLQDLLVGFGPSIRSCCFEVENDFKSNFPYGLLKREGKTFMDIALINQRQLVDSGVKQANIFDPKFCTFSDEGFFSFRKEAKNAGRLISAIMLK
ncbi:MAG: multicopper polyphenol oxidase [Candidatus Omnitrophica bacterium CG11_big_fil_rev_8_21_14_0_20_43_6]|nr:MAG: multicopper polyphenol oxidase [Candidatus Omnitrophica bacterium CG11_big_fil_rev_8_21_14_0_20_43_6]